MPGPGAGNGTRCEVWHSGVPAVTLGDRVPRNLLSVRVLLYQDRFGPRLGPAVWVNNQNTSESAEKDQGPGHQPGLLFLGCDGGLHGRPGVPLEDRGLN